MPGKRKHIYPAGIKPNRLSLALEPEAAALYVRHIPFEVTTQPLAAGYDDSLDGLSMAEGSTMRRSFSMTAEGYLMIERNDMKHKDSTVYGLNQDQSQRATLDKMGAGCEYMVLDAGGGTVDIAVHETKDDGKLREVYMANGGDLGGTKVQRKDGFQNFLTDLTSPRTNSSDKGIDELEGGKKVLKAFEENYIDEDLEMKRDFEQKKRGIEESMKSKLTMRISPQLHEAFAQIYPGENLMKLDLNRFDGNVKWVRDKLQINNPVACSFFKEPINKIVEHVKQIFSQPELEGTERILMVGGFSECPLLVSAIRKAFPSKVVIVPRDAGLVVLKGAVIFGHDQNVFCEHISKYTYGLKCEGRFIRREHPLEYRFIDKDGAEWCHNLFDIHVEIGQAIRFGEPQSIRFYQPSRFVKDDIFHFSIFGTKSKKPKFVTDNGVHKAGQVTLRIPPDDVDYDSEITVSLTFSGTELEAVAEYRKTGQKEKSYIGYLE